MAIVTSVQIVQLFLKLFKIFTKVDKSLSHPTDTKRCDPENHDDQNRPQHTLYGLDFHLFIKMYKNYRVI
jgi:hypothetical protein